jgi:hypothetical protein
LMFVMMAMSISAADTQIGDKFYTINFPKNDYYAWGQTSKVYIQAQNCTGLFLTGTQVECSMQVYNTTGEIISRGAMTFDAPYSFYFTLNENITNNAGIYPYDVYCNSTCCGGFASSTLKVGESGPLNSEISPGMVVILAMLLFVTGFFAVFFATQKHPLTYFFTILTLVVVDASVWIGYKVATMNFYPYAFVYFRLFWIIGIVTFIMLIVTMLDVTRMVIFINQRKKAAKNIARFGYA